MKRSILVAVGTLTAIAGTAAPVYAAGLHREEQAARATALAQAVTAQVDDPSAVYYNPAALAFAQDRAAALGFDLVHGLRGDFFGADPVPGTSETGERRLSPAVRPHAYWVEPVARRWTVGVALHQAAGFETDWESPDSWSGGFEARHVEWRAWDLDAAAARRFGEAWGIAVGLTIRASSFDWERSAAGTVLRLDSETDIAAGPVVAIQHRPAGRWSWGLRWRGGISSNLDGRVEQPASAPLPWSADLDLPDRTSVGVAFSPTPTITLEADVDRSAWSSLGEVSFLVPGQPSLDRTPVGGWKDRTAVRFGIGWYGLGNGEWRAGVFHDPTPQPASGLGPFFVGADRYGASIGYGARVRRLQTDLALAWEEHETRDTATHGFDGEYRTRMLRLVLTFGW